MMPALLSLCELLPVPTALSNVMKAFHSERGTRNFVTPTSGYQSRPR